MKDKQYILEINIDDKNLPIPTPEIKHERDLAIYDLLQENYFKIDNNDEKKFLNGPYCLTITIKKTFLVFIIEDHPYSNRYEIHLSLTPFKPVIRDYFEICKSYFNAVKRLPPTQIETIDMGRRGIHLEGSRVLIERLSGKITTDTPTAKRLFTLICALHLKW